MLYPILCIIAVLIVASLILYFVKTAPDAILDPIFKWVIRAVVIIVAVLMILYWAFGMFGGTGFHGLPGPGR